MGDIADIDELKKKSSQPELFTISEVVDQESQQRERTDSIYSADLETAITATGCGKFNYVLIFLSLTGSCANAFGTGSISYVIPAASVDLNLTPSDRALLQSSIYAGMILSSIIWGSLSDAFGRKKLLIIGYLSDSFMSFMAGALPFLPLMLLFKFLSGCIICGPFLIFSTYLSEVYPKKGRDLAVLSMGLTSAAAQIILAGLAGLIMPIEVPSGIPFKSWQLFLIACSIPTLISGIICCFLFESPKFLADKGNHEEALKVFQTIYSINTGKLSSTYPIKSLKYVERKTEKKSNFSKFSSGMEIFRPPFVQKAVIVFMMQFVAFGSYNILRLWLPEMLTIADTSTLDPEEGLCSLLFEGNLGRSNLTTESFRNEQIFSKLMLVNTGRLIAQILFLVIVGFIGKKIIQLNCTLGAAVCSILIPYVSADYIVIITSCLLGFLHVYMFTNISIVVKVFPTRMRATTVGAMMMIVRMGTIPLNFLIVNLLYTYCEYFFYVLSSSLLVTAGLTLIVRRKPMEDEVSTPSKENKISTPSKENE